MTYINPTLQTTFFAAGGVSDIFQAQPVSTEPSQPLETPSAGSQYISPDQYLQLNDLLFRTELIKRLVELRGDEGLDFAEFAGCSIRIAPEIMESVRNDLSLYKHLHSSDVRCILNYGHDFLFACPRTNDDTKETYFLYNVANDGTLFRREYAYIPELSCVIGGYGAKLYKAKPVLVDDKSAFVIVHGRNHLWSYNEDQQTYRQVPAGEYLVQGLTVSAYDPKYDAQVFIKVILNLDADQVSIYRELLRYSLLPTGTVKIFGKRRGRIFPLKNYVAPKVRLGVNRHSHPVRFFERFTLPNQANLFLFPDELTLNGRIYYGSGDHRNIVVANARSGNLKPVGAKQFVTLEPTSIFSTPPSEAWMISAEPVGLSRTTIARTDSKKGKFYSSVLTLASEDYSRKVKVYIEADSSENAQERLGLLLKYLSTIRYGLLGKVRKITLLKESSSIYGIKNVGADYNVLSDDLRFFSFASKKEAEELHILNHELWHSLSPNERLPLIMAIKAEGARASKIISNRSPFRDYHLYESFEYKSEVGALLTCGAITADEVPYIAQVLGDTLARSEFDITERVKAASRRRKRTLR